MPIYAFRCKKCGDFEQYRPVSQCDKPFQCPECGVKSPQILSLPNTPMAGYDKPIHSEAMGINPSQVTAAHRRYPDRKYDNEGRRVFRSHHERSKALKEEGFHDNDGVSGGPSR